MTSAPPIAEDRCARPAEATALLRWPADRPAAALVGCDLAGGQRALGRRWSRIGEPVDEITLRSGDFTTDEPPAETLRRRLHPEQGVWPLVGWLAYDLGAAIEPTAQAKSKQKGEAGSSAPLARFASLDPPPSSTEDDIAGGYRLEPLISEMGEAAYRRAVERAVRLIHQGDVFQVNVAHRMRGGFAGSTRRLFVDLVEAMAPAFAAYIESPSDPSVALLSLSPELFLDVDGATGAATTRPIKGTLAAAQPPGRLAASEKDAAELAMIVDLMRNDLGRVCQPGTIHVLTPRAIERCGGLTGDRGVWHGVATVRGRLAGGRDIFDLLAAAFPAGSITGAPKIRAMQRIDELEPTQRGPCFGSVGFLDGAGGGVFNVAIRTAIVQGEALQSGCFGQIRGRLNVHVGAGAVADSNPLAEWRETLIKAEGFTRAARCGSRRAPAELAL